jgi:uncharacterized membrane protein YfcA
MIIDPVVIAVIAIVFVAAAVSSTFGFANALIAMPLLALMIDLDIARPLVALVALTIAVVIVLTDWRHVAFSSAWRLVVSSLVGVPVGFFLLTRIPGTIVKLALAVLILGFAGYSRIGPRGFALKSEWWTWPFGFVAGILGGAYNTPGPPVAILGSLKKWSAPQFRATFQGYALPISAAITAGHRLTGRLTSGVFWLYVLSLPVLVLAILLGGWLNRRIQTERFALFIHILLMLIGTSLLVETIRTALAST